MKAIRYEKDTVLIQKGKIKAWVDVVVYDGELYMDWNKYIFTMTDPEDTTLKNWQDNLANFEDATDLAVTTLENLGIIYQDSNGKWHQTEKYHSTTGSRILTKKYLK